MHLELGTSSEKLLGDFRIRMLRTKSERDRNIGTPGRGQDEKKRLGRHGLERLS